MSAASSPHPNGGLGPGRAFGGRDWGKEMADISNYESDSLNTVLTVAATSRMIWLCACVRAWLGVHVSLAFKFV